MPRPFRSPSDELLALESDAREMADPLTDEEREDQQDWIWENVMCVTKPKKIEPSTKGD